MNRKQKAEKIGLLLDELYPSTPVPLNHKDSYTLIVAVMLSAQTTDKKVNQALAITLLLLKTLEQNGSMMRKY